MAKSAVFHCSRYRVQLTVFDYIVTAVESGKSKRTINFSVAVLDFKAKRYTAFSTGIAAYHGPDLSKAVASVEHWLGYPIKLPKLFKQYEGER